MLASFNNISAGYGGADIIKNISFDVRANENLLIIGPNGCGKTTLLKTAAGILPYRGEITIAGRQAGLMRRRDLSRQVALLSQVQGAFFDYTVFDTVMMGRYIHIEDTLWGRPSARDNDFVLQCLKTVNLLNEASQLITELSGGQLQRVFLARTLAQDPRIILLDEPTNHLDLKYQFELSQYLKEWSKTGDRAVIGVLHDLNLAMRLGDRFIMMKDGVVKAAGAPAEIMNAKLLKDVFDMDVAGYMLESLREWEKMSGYDK